MKKIIYLLLILLVSVPFATVSVASEINEAKEIIAASETEVTESEAEVTESEAEVAESEAEVTESEAEVTESEAEVDFQDDRLREYVEEKIVPVLMGVITSVVALLSTLKGIFSSLKLLKESKENFDKDREKIKEESKKELEKITEKYVEIKSEVNKVCLLLPEVEKLKGQASVLSKEIANLSEIVSLGFTKNQELVKEGIARKAVLLSDENKEIIDSEAV